MHDVQPSDRIHLTLIRKVQYSCRFSGFPLSVNPEANPRNREIFGVVQRSPNAAFTMLLNSSGLLCVLLLSIFIHKIQEQHVMQKSRSQHK